MAEVPSVAVKFDPDKIRIKLGGEHSLIRRRRVFLEQFSLYIEPYLKIPY